MMKLIDQVCTLEQAKKLSELGIANNALFQHGSNGELIEEWMIEGNEDKFYPAFTVAELGAMLPDYTVTWFGNTNMGEMGWITDSLKSICRRDSRYDMAPMDKHDTEAQARAILLIELLESGKITPDEVNTRLQ